MDKLLDGNKMLEQLIDMSWSKSEKPEDYYKRDSLSDRVCDDLFEVILQFLPIKDKFRLT